MVRVLVILLTAIAVTALFELTPMVLALADGGG